MATTITRTLAVPLVDQNHEGTMDGKPDENAGDNCLFASCASALTGLHPGGPSYDGDEIKDAVMGQGYTGFGYFCQALTNYLAANGANITVETSGDLAGLAHSFIDRGIALLAVIPSLWNTQSGAVSPSFSTHVVLLCGDGPGGWLRAMNPWGGFWHDNPDGWWASRFCYGALWALIPKGGQGIGMAGGGVPAGWHDDGTTLTAPNGVQSAGYIRAHILGEDWPANLWPVAPLYGIGQTGWQQDFAAATRSIVASLSGVMSEKPGPDYFALAQQQQARADAAQVQVSQLTAQLAAANAEIARLKAAGNGGGGAPGAPAPSAADIAAATVAALAAKLSAA